VRFACFLRCALTALFLWTFMQNQFNAVVVGGGVAGHASALALAQCGLSVGFVTQDAAQAVPTAHVDARVYALSNSNVQFLRDLRVWDALNHERTCAITQMRVFGDGGSRQSSQGVLDLTASSAQQMQLACMIEQSNLQHVLSQAIQFSPNIHLFKSAAAHLEQRETGVSITTNDGQTLTADLLVGCDGANSCARQAFGIGMDVHDYGQCGVVAHFSCERPHNGVAHQWFLPNAAVLALLPLPNQQVSMVYSCATALASEVVQLEPPQLSKLIGGLSGHVLGDLTALNAAQSFGLTRSCAQRFVDNRLVLVGDAAHTIHPMSGQGLNLGLQDIALLRDLIAQRATHQSIFEPRLLRQYERARLTQTVKMQAVTHTLNRLFEPHHVVIQTARNLGMSLLNQAPALKRWLINNAL
jgi:ubiquinone biosynthesis UbiH/UbiF/VisC/COQ6 family hydroxylase